MVIEIDKRNIMVVLALGGNVGDVKNTLLNSIKYLEEHIGKVRLVSSLYRTKAWGVENQPDFINQVIALETDLSAFRVLEICLSIETQLGRKRTKSEKWQKRVVDIDLLFYGNEIIHATNLIVPHPFIKDRNFVLIPLAEILPGFMHPVLNKTVEELKKRCLDNLKVIRCLD